MCVTTGLLAAHTLVTRVLSFQQEANKAGLEQQIAEKKRQQEAERERAREAEKKEEQRSGHSPDRVATAQRGLSAS
jgi:hypothetical protein